MAHPSIYAAYQQQIHAARNVGLGLAEAQAKQLQKILEQYAAELETVVSKQLQGSGAHRTKAIVGGILTELQAELQSSTAAGVRLTSRQLATMQARATLAVLSAEGMPKGVDIQAYGAAMFDGVATRAGQAVLARPEHSAAFRNIRKACVEEVDATLARGIVQGKDASAIARAIRVGITGAEGIPASHLQDLRKIGPATLEAMGIQPDKANVAELRKYAGGISRRARLIARTEITAAEHEADIQAAIESPVVAGIQWYLSNRHPEPCECDALALTDWYGLGPGVYDPRKVPPRPHPRCLCGRTHILRPPAEWGRPRGAIPPLVLDPFSVARDLDFTPSRRRSLARAIGVGEGKPATIAPGTPEQAAAYQTAREAELQDAKLKYKNTKASTKHALKAKEQQADQLKAKAAAEAAAAAAKIKAEQEAAVAAAAAAAKQKAAAEAAAAAAKLKAEQEAAAAAAAAAAQAAAAQAAKQAHAVKRAGLLKETDAVNDQVAAAGKSVAQLKAAVTAAQANVAKAAGSGSETAKKAALATYTDASDKLAAKQAANKASSEAHIAKQKAAKAVSLAAAAAAKKAKEAADQAAIQAQLDAQFSGQVATLAGKLGSAIGNIAALKNLIADGFALTAAANLAGASGAAAQAKNIVNQADAALKAKQAANKATSAAFAAKKAAEKAAAAGSAPKLPAANAGTSPTSGASLKPAPQPALKTEAQALAALKKLPDAIDPLLGGKTGGKFHGFGTNKDEDGDAAGKFSPTYPGIGFDIEAKHILTGAPVKQVPIGKLLGTQVDVLPDQVTKYIQSGSLLSNNPNKGAITGLPIVVKYQGKLYIVEGHHRLAAHRLLGYTNAHVRLVDADAINELAKLGNLPSKAAQMVAAGAANTAAANPPKPLATTPAVAPKPAPKKKPAPKPAPAPVAPPAPTVAPSAAASTKQAAPLKDTDILHQEVVGAPKGSNAGGRYIGKDGKHRYVKFYDDPTQAQSEVLANEIYRGLGLGAPKSGTFMHKGKLAYWSEIADDVEGTLKQKGLTKALADKALDGFAADVLTGNWDAVGMSFDNMVVTKSGALLRIDQGGTFLFRAQNGRKPGSVLNTITEWDYFANPKNPSYHAVFHAAGLTNANELGKRVVAQIDAILAFEKKQGGWSKFVDRIAPGLSPTDRTAIKTMLAERSSLLADKRSEVANYKQQLAAQVKQQAAQAAALKKNLGKPPAPSAADKKQITELSQAILKLPKATRDLIKARIEDQIITEDSEGHKLRKQVDKVKKQAMFEMLQKRGLSSLDAKALVSHYDGFFTGNDGPRGWQGSADDSPGSAAIKWFAVKKFGLPTSYHWGTFYDADQKKRAQLVAEGRTAATLNGTFQEADVMALFEMEHNFTRAFGQALGIKKMSMYRNVNAGYFGKHNLATPKTGAQVVVEHNAVVGFRGTRYGYDHPSHRLRVDDYQWDDVLRHFWTHGSAAYNNENEIWVLWRPVIHHVEKDGSTGKNYFTANKENEPKPGKHL